LCLGEIVVDWILPSKGGKPVSSSCAEKHAAGTPANVAVGLSRQSINAGVIGRLGDDQSGRWLKEVLDKEGVDTSGLVLDPRARTRQIMVGREPNGERRPLGMRIADCADFRLEPGDLKPQQFSQASAFYFGSTSLRLSPIAQACERALELARDHNLLVVCDVNIWPAMWADAESCRRTVLEKLRCVDLLKVNIDELEFLSGYRHERAGAEQLQARFGVPVVLVTLGESGAFISAGSGSIFVPAVPVSVVEPAGAGDAFVAATIAGVLPLLDPSPGRRNQLWQLPIDRLAPIVERANAAGALVASRLGALCAMPTPLQIEGLLAGRLVA